MPGSPLLSPLLSPPRESARTAEPAPATGLTGVVRTIGAPLLGVLARLADRIGGLLFAASDAEARWHGWQVVATRGGLRRQYRHPVFDALITCPVCQGTGLDTAQVPASEVPASKADRPQAETPCILCARRGPTGLRSPSEQALTPGRRAPPRRPPDNGHRVYGARLVTTRTL